MELFLFLLLINVLNMSFAWPNVCKNTLQVLESETERKSSEVAISTLRSIPGSEWDASCEMERKSSEVAISTLRSIPGSEWDTRLTASIVLLRQPLQFLVLTTQFDMLCPQFSCRHSVAVLLL